MTSITVADHLYNKRVMESIIEELEGRYYRNEENLHKRISCTRSLRGGNPETKLRSRPVPSKRIRLCPGWRVIPMAKPQSKRYEALLAAMEIIDPEGALIPGSTEHNQIIDTILRDIDNKGPEAALDEYERTKEHHRAQIRYIALM